MVNIQKAASGCQDFLILIAEKASPALCYRHPAMETWQSDIKKGVRHLSQHQPGKALGFFCKALEGCPVAKSRSLSRLLFYLGVTLRRLGCVDSAVKSWLLSYKLTKDSFSLKMINPNNAETITIPTF